MSLQEYIQKLINLINLERKTEIELMKEEIKKISGREREKKQRAILNLKVKWIKREFNYYLVFLARKEKITTKIEVGDLVLVSKGNPLSSNLIGTLTEKRKNSIIIALNDIPHWLFESKIRIDLCANEVTFKREIRNLKNLNFQGKKAILFFLKKKKPQKSYFREFDSFNEKLNSTQRKAVGLSLGSEDFFLIHGPFGTGKTTTLIELILQEVKRKNKVLVTAESNVAVDNLVEGLFKKAKIVRIGHPSRVARHLKETTLSFLVQSHKDFEKLESLKNVSEKIRENRDKFLRPTREKRRGLSKKEILKLARKGKTKRGLKIEQIKEMAEWIKLNREFKKVLNILTKVEEYIAKEIIKNSEVVLTTNSSAGLEILNNFFFDVVIIDEASQATVPSCLIPISKAKKFILAGDHKQLPPTILNREAKELSFTLFEGLISNFPQKAILLNVQYRMNNVLMEFPNKEFYGGKIKTSSKVKKIFLGSFLDQIFFPQKPIIFIDTKKCKNKYEIQKVGSTSRENFLEAKIVSFLIKKFLRKKIKREWIGVITPYDDQVELIKSFIGREIEVSSVDGFQGREKEVIIISFVRSNKEKELGFLEDERRLNVALTRAKRKLILIGDSQTLKANSIFKRLIYFVKNKGGYLQISKLDDIVNLI